MKIAILGKSWFGGGYGRIISFKNYLLSKGHDVEVIALPEQTIFSKIWFYYHSSYVKFIRKSTQLAEKIAELMEKRINKGKYDVVIGVESKFSYVLVKDLNCLKLFSCESLEADERYFSKKSNLKEVNDWREKELEIFMNSDYVIFPWKTTENYVRKYIHNGDNLITINYGCHPKERTVSYFFPISIVATGNYRYYWSNKELLSFLTKISPYVFDVYGKYKPEKKYKINYKGFAESLDILYNYQFGVNTVSKDLFRQNHFSSKILSYLAYGLPVLFPEWQKFPNELKGCLPYNENNFIEIIERYSERERWEKLSQDAINQGRDLDWNIVLKPLDKLIEG